MLGSGSESDNVWDFSTPFIRFDNYKDDDQDSHEARHSSESTAARNGYAPGNISFQDSESDEQRFFPSFPAPYHPFGRGPGRAPLFPGPAANRAPSRYNSPPPYNGNRAPPNRGPLSAFSAESHERYQDSNQLGSGNFAVVRGGTYYADNDDIYHGHGGYHNPGDDDDYYHPYSNGHSQPHGYRGGNRGNTNNGGGDFFANFRDFADISPPSRAYSHHHQALASEESPQLLTSASRQPKNILEKLQTAFIDRSHDEDPMVATF